MATPEQLYRRSLREAGYDLKRNQMRELTRFYPLDHVFRILGDGPIERTENAPNSVTTHRHIAIRQIMTEMRKTKKQESYLSSPQNSSVVAAEIAEWKKQQKDNATLDIIVLERAKWGGEIAEALLELTIPGQTPSEQPRKILLDDFTLEAMLGTEFNARDLVDNLDEYAQIAAKKIGEEAKFNLSPRD